ncbi:MAG: hypothetical protein AB7J13_05630 [Pyrinomonadaceae bacterium]
MKRSWIGILVLILSLVVAVSAQTPPPPKDPKPPAGKPAATPTAAVVAQPCPKLQVRTAQRPVRDGTPVRFTATLSGGDPAIAAMFSWSISAGAISSGQNTPSITVDTTGAGAAREITATLLVGGYPGECGGGVMESATVAVAGPAVKVDQYGMIPEAEEKDRLARLMSVVTSNERAYIIAYAGRDSIRGYARSKLQAIRAHLIKEGSSPNQIVTMDGGYREEATHELWWVPNGAESPRPEPTINPRDIVFPKRTPPKKP